MPKRSHMCGGITRSPLAPASRAITPCSAASVMLSVQIPEITGSLPFASSATMRVTSARSCAESANTSPVWPFVVSPASPSNPHSQPVKRRSSGSSIDWSGRNGTCIAGTMPL